MDENLRVRPLGIKISLYLLGFVLIPFVLISFLVYLNGKQTAEQVTRDRLAEIGRQVGTEAERIVFSAMTHTLNLASNPILRSREEPLEGKLKEMEKIQRFFYLFEDITLLDPDGNVLASTSYEYRGEWLTKDWFIKAKAGDTVVSPVHAVLHPFRLVLVFCSPVYSPDGAMLGVVAGQLNMKKIWEITDGVRMGDTGYVFLTDEKGNILAHPDKELLLTKFDEPALKDAIRTPPEESLVYFLDGHGQDNTVHVHRLEGYKDYSGQNWRIGVVQDMREAFLVVRSAGRQVVLIVASGVLLLFLLLILLNRKILLPIRELAGAMFRIASGDLETKVPVRRGDELADLGNGFNRMVDDLKQIQGRFVAEKERLSVTLRMIADGVVAVDREGIIILMNHSASRVMECAEEAAVGMKIGSVFPVICETSSILPLSDEHLFSDRHSESSTPFRCKQIKRGGLERKIEVVITPISKTHDERLGAVIVLRDVTDQDRIQEEVLRGRKLESLGLLAGGIAHDFNNILTAILANLSSARFAITPGTEVHDLLGRAEEETFRARSLSNQLLSFAKGGAPIRRTASLKEIVRDSGEFVLRGSKNRAEFHIEEDVRPADVDTEQISRVIQNIVINADHAMPHGGIIRIRLENADPWTIQDMPLEPGPYVRITISDDGPGIPPVQLSRIFDPYFTTKAGGSGLGLSMAYSILKNHGGSITVESRLSVGTTFTIYLPASEKTVSGRREEVPLRTPGTGKILLMDDDERVLESIARGLSLFGYDTELAGSGEQAIEMFAAALAAGEPFDAVVLDLTIQGGMGGKEVIRELGKMDPRVVSIVSSGYSDDPVMANFREHGFSGVMPKPYHIKALSDMLRDFLRVKQV